MPHEEYGESGSPYYPESGSNSEPSIPTNEEAPSPFLTSDPESIVERLLASVQDERLDRIRSITFSSLNTEDPFNSARGAFRGLQIIFSLGKGHFLKQAFV